MKRKGYLYDAVMTGENVHMAYDLYNANRPTWLRHPYDRLEADTILMMMKADFGAVVGKPRKKRFCDKGKWRELEIPGTFASSIAQLALWNVCGRYVERRIHDCSFSSRKGMGGHILAKKVARLVRTHGDKEAKYCFYFDIRKYYAHIDKRIVMDRLATIFKDKKVLDMFRAVVYSTPKGLPIGYPFSHALANLYISPLYCLAHSIKGISTMYVYMDNHLVFSAHKAPLKRFHKLAKQWLAGVGCEIKDDWQIFPTAVRPVRVCGLTVKADGTRRLYRKLWHRTMRNFDRLRRFYKRSDYLGMQSRLGWLDLCNRRYCEAFKHEGGYLWR